ncbi:MAG: DUF721 domain-containing protein [Candidatus Peregrinibacteria bacterium]
MRPDCRKHPAPHFLPSSIEHLRDLLPAVLKKRGLQAQAEAALVCHRTRVWLQEQNPTLAAYATVQSFHDGVLLIKSPHSVASQELQMVSPDLLSFLQLGGHQSVKEIRIVRC